ncbi:protein FAM13A isoform X1 [Anolis carolinensis]|uniref:protein FAM13A isoform X1 n=1 Tax=Anolis carolinensis TaxID=28377 RepID=UPI0004629ED5|nr:PREDICTED: protein FAM13A isoform X1 [Anolis carolinensis]|eukprot:XP_008109247.1 PREDICTED: protein FAM13A isoform X1 [Anolis carolinensis]
MGVCMFLSQIFFWGELCCEFVSPRAMQPPVVTLTECSAFLCSFKQSKSAVRLKEDMKKIACAPLKGQRGIPVRRVFGTNLQELQQQGLSKNGIPDVVWDIVEYLTRHGLKQEGLFRVNGSLKTVEQLRLKYESGEEVDLVADGDVSSAASLLKLFLRELPDRVITSAAHPKFMQLYQDSRQHGLNANSLRELLRQLPEVHYRLLKYLCHFLRRVAEHHSENKMNISNLATVFGPNCFHVSPGFEGMKEQETCNKIMAYMLENFSALFEWEHMKKENEMHPCEELSKIILVKEASCKQNLPVILTSVERETPKRSPRNKITKCKQEGSSLAFLMPQPRLSDGIPRVSIHLTDSSCPEEMDLADDISFMSSTAFFTSSQEDERPMSPFYLSAHVPQVNNNSIPATGEFLEKTIRSAVEQHLFDVHGSGGQSSEDSESGTSSTSSNVSARQRRRHHKEQDEARRTREREVINKENIPSGFSGIDECMLTAQEVEKLQENSSGYVGERSKPKRQKSSSKLSELNDNQDTLLTMETFAPLRPVDRTGPDDDMEVFSEDSKDSESDGDIFRHSQCLTMKIQEHPSLPETKLQRNQDPDGQEETFVSEVPRLDLTALCSDNNWEEPVPAFSSWQRDGLDSDEARLSPQAGRLIRQLLDEDSDPMLSPRFYAYGQSQQYLDDTEVPPSPPNSHSFMRRRSSSLGSYEDDREDLTPAQLTRRIQGLKKKIRRFEEKFEEERKYRPSHSDKAANLEVLKWTNDLAKFRKQLKESKLKMSEEDLVPVMRQRSNTLPKSFGSQLEKEEEKKQDVPDKSSKPAVEATLETMQKKLQEKRAEANRPEDIKDMTRDQIAAEKVALQKSLLYYESIHGRPITKHERHMMKPLYDRYRLVKQILSRANSIPIIGSPSSKRRSPLLQPIIEGETASFFKEIKEEEDGSEDDSNTKPDFTVTIKSDFNVRSFLDQLEDDTDGFVSPVDDRIPSRGGQDMGLSNLHAASMPELVEQLQEVREEKKRIRKKLRDFEDNFFRQNGRNVQKEDRTPMAEEYNEYKQVKAKLRLLEVLISKRDFGSKIM